ncbi:hypothetical protein OAE15_01465 [Verrucomicrobiales bacterium]|nr:hypothetical protein [Verrucomicrobiales bacterium]
MATRNLVLLHGLLSRFLAEEWEPKAGRQDSTYAISLTSWSKRLNDLQLTLVTLINQEVRPAAIYVWLTEDDLNLIPRVSRRLFEAQGVQFETCVDYRSHKKWLPLILSGHHKPFVVCDDDIFYPREWFGRLVAEDRMDAYVGCKCHRMSAGESGLPGSYSDWEKLIYHQEVPSEALFATGCGGVIIHPKRLSERALDWTAIQEYALFSDDAWLKAAHLASGIPVFKTRYCFPCLELPGTDESGLLANHNTDGNDEQIEAVWAYFGLEDTIGGSS